MVRVTANAGPFGLAPSHELQVEVRAGGHGIVRGLSGQMHTLLWTATIIPALTVKFCSSLATSHSARVESCYLQASLVGGLEHRVSVPTGAGFCFRRSAEKIRTNNEIESKCSASGQK